MSRRVEVVVWSSVKRPLTYEVAEETVPAELPGRRVIVPVGGRAQVGLITGLDDIYTGPVKSVTEFCDTEPIMTATELELCRFLADYYCASLAESVKAWLPGALTRRLRERFRLRSPERLEELAAAGDAEAQLIISLLGRLTEIDASRLTEIKRTTLRRLLDSGVLSRHWLLPRGRAAAIDYLVSLTGNGDRRRLGAKGTAILEYLGERGEIPLSQLRRELEVSPTTTKSLVERGLIRMIEPPPFELQETPVAKSKMSLTSAQTVATEKIAAGIESREFAPFLLHGVTGSGKTEVYLRAAQRVVESGRSVIIIVPEIGLAQAMYYRLRETFGDRLALLHSRLSPRSRLDLWQEAREGRRSVILGPRSAIFAAVPQLGLIVVDEEHDQSLKQESPAPRYHARDAALYRARLEKCAVILGSATPALESYYNARQGKYQLLELPERVDKRALPRVSVVDLRLARERKDFGYLSKELVQEMKESLGAGGQVMLLLNRRGFSPSVRCYGCGARFGCRFCAVTLVYHKSDNTLLCHSCGYRQPYPESCPECGGKLLLFRGIGTEKLVEEVRRDFPATEIARMDLDTTRRVGAFDEVFNSFKEGRARILVGTQMIAKGFDFPDVALMGVISADTALELPDFRARERTFQLLTQAAGRAGRHRFSGRVLLQTFHADDPTIALAVEHDYRRFYETEVAEREEVGFPPFRRLILVALEGSEPAAVQKAAEWLAVQANSVRGKQFQLLGPVPAPISRRRGQWRYQLLV
ncbi:MAG: primosomal protein N', partial [bacterium]